MNSNYDEVAATVKKAQLLMSRLIARQKHRDLCLLVKCRQVKVTAEMIAAVTNPAWKQELIEAICLSKVGG
jgi:hypothetical protein